MNLFSKLFQDCFACFIKVRSFQLGPSHYESPPPHPFISPPPPWLPPWFLVIKSQLLIGLFCQLLFLLWTPNFVCSNSIIVNLKISPTCQKLHLHLHIIYQQLPPSLQMTPFNFRGVKHIWVRTAVMKIYNFGALPVFRFEVSPILTTTSISRKSPTLYCLLPAYITVENTNLHFTFSFVISFAYCLFPSQSCLAVRFFKRDWGRSIVYKTSGGCWSYVHWCQNLWHLKYWSAKHTSIKPATLQGSTHCKWLGELVASHLVESVADWGLAGEMVEGGMLLQQCNAMQ